jgi:hypothetical protein
MRMNGAAAVSMVAFPSVDINYQAFAIADYNHDGVSDIFWRHKVTGGNAFFFMRNFAPYVLAETKNLADPNWQGAGPR